MNTAQEVRHELAPQKNQSVVVIKRLLRSPTAIIGLVILTLFVFTATVGPFLAPFNPLDQDLTRGLQGMSKTNWLGTDHVGRDVFSRLIHGSRVSLFIGLASIAIGLVIGLTMGLVGGFYGGWIDAGIMRVVDILMAFPGTLLAIAVISVLGPGVRNTIFAVAAFSIPGFARITRASVISIKELEFVEASKAIGNKTLGIMFKHILPNALSPLIVQSSLRVGTAILTASGLSFLGFGVQPPNPEWGAMLAIGRQYLLYNPVIAVAPGIAITLVVLSFSLLGDGLRDALDPRLKH